MAISVESENLKADAPPRVSVKIYCRGRKPGTSTDCGLELCDLQGDSISWTAGGRIKRVDLKRKRVQCAICGHDNKITY